MVTLSEEQIVQLKKFAESLKKDEGFLTYMCGLIGLEKDQPSMAGLLSYAERYIRTQHGLFNGSWSGESGPYDITISFKVKQDKTTT